MITPGDEYPIHQTPEPVQQVFTSDRNFYDRFFFNGCWPEGEPFFAVAMGVYPNLGIMDAAFSVSVDGVQHCLRASRLLGADRMATQVGPIAIDIVKPGRTLRVKVDHKDLQADIRFDGRIRPIEEPRFTRRAGPRIVMDMTRFTQHGSYTGTLTVAGRTFTADPQRVHGVRDRSWGVRTVGGRETGGAPMQEEPQFFWLWAPANFADRVTLFAINENADGSRWHQFGAIGTADPEAVVEPTGSVDWKLDYLAGTRHAKTAEVILHGRGGKNHRVELEVLYNFYMHGISYGHPKWGHGMYVGDDVSDYETFKVADVDQSDPICQHIEAVCRAKMGERKGIGVLEMLIIGPHQPSGFAQMLDMHG